MSEPGVASPGLAVPADGVLEELDGRPIGRPSIRGSLPGDALPAPGVPWRRGVAAATAMTVRRPSLWVYALVAFLARGGIVVLVLPIVVAPTFIGLANFVGPASVSAGGPGPRLVALIVVGLAATTVLVVVGACVAAAAEVALHRATAATPEARAVGATGLGSAAVFAAAAAAAAAAATPAASAPRPGRGTLETPAPSGPSPGLPAFGSILLVPVAIVAAVAIPAWVAVAYRELTVPSDVAAPLAARVLAGAPAASVAVLAAWLAAEIVGGFAVRRSVLLGSSMVRALAGGFGDPFRAPLATALTVAVALGATLVALVATWWVTGVAWDAARQALGGGLDALAVLGAAVLMAAAWLAGLVLAAGAAAWRATLVTMELLRRRR